MLLDPPSAPIITGYQPGSILAAGTVQRMMCISSGGNPLATLTWFKNDKKVNRKHSQSANHCVGLQSICRETTGSELARHIACDACGLN